MCIRDSYYTGTDNGSPNGRAHQIKEVYSDGQLRKLIAASGLLGDINQDGAVNFLDFSPFIQLLNNGYVAQADTNRDGVVNFLDLSPFILLLNLPDVPVHNVDSILQVSGDTDIGGRAFTSYASQKMTYYVGDEPTADIATSWKDVNENLETSSGGLDLNE